MRLCIEILTLRSTVLESDFCPIERSGLNFSHVDFSHKLDMDMHIEILHTNPKITFDTSASQRPQIWLIACVMEIINVVLELGRK